MNRAIAVVHFDSLPADLTAVFTKVRKEAAFSCGFFPVLYEIGIQVVLVSSAKTASIDLKPFVDKISNQWSIIQSVFLIDDNLSLISSARTWGQVITGKYQNLLEKMFQSK